METCRGAKRRATAFNVRDLPHSSISASRPRRARFGLNHRGSSADDAARRATWHVVPSSPPHHSPPRASLARSRSMAAARLAPGAFASGSSLGVSLAPRAGPAAPRSPARGGPRRRHLRRRGADDSRGAASSPGVVVARAAASSDVAAPKTSADVVIVGGGLAGLCCARRLAASGVDFVLLESSDGVGGRLRTDVVDGFLLDRGFAIFLTGYPEARATLDYDALDLRPFYAGADVRFEGAFHRVADPLRHPLDAIASLAPSHPIGSVFDKILVGLVRLNALLGDVYDSLTAPETTIAGRLNERGVSPEMQHRVVRPFMSGIFFDPKLGTSSRLFEFVMRMLAVGQNCLPARGIGDVAEQLLEPSRATPCASTPRRWR